MGNSGLRKLIIPMDLVETKYSNHSEIDLLTLDKQVVRVPSGPHKNVLFLHYRRTVPEGLINRITQLNSNETLVVMLPDGECPDTFQQIKQRYPKSFAKVNINGDDMHPLFKYLKRNCTAMYEPFGMGGKHITQTVGAFLVKGGEAIEGSEEQQIRYFRESDLPELLGSLPAQPS